MPDPKPVRATIQAAAVVGNAQVDRGHRRQTIDFHLRCSQLIMQGITQPLLPRLRSVLWRIHDTYCNCNIARNASLPSALPASRVAWSAGLEQNSLAEPERKTVNRAEQKNL